MVKRRKQPLSTRGQKYSTSGSHRLEPQSDKRLFFKDGGTVLGIECIQKKQNQTLECTVGRPLKELLHALKTEGSCQSRYRVAKRQHTPRDCFVFSAIEVGTTSDHSEHEHKYKSIATMSGMKPNVQEDKDVERVSASPGHTLEPLPSHTFCPRNNAAGNSLPSGALVNGPGSHPTSEVHCVLNKGTVLSNNVLDAAWRAEKDTSPEVLPPPSELQSDAWKNTAAPAVKTPATQPGVNAPLSHLEGNESKLACCTLSGDGAEQMHISKTLQKQTIEAGSRHSVEWSQGSSDDYGDVEVVRWDSTSESFLHSGRRQETRVMHQRERQHNTHVRSMSGSQGKVNDSLNHTCRCYRGGNDVENVDIANKDDALDTQSGMKYSVLPFKDLPRNRALDSEQRISQEGSNEENDPEDEDCFSQKVEQLKAEQLEQDPSFFSRTICNVNLEEKRHFHRHMMYHLGRHNQVNSENVSQAFICRECGRLFCDRNSLMRHIIIHQDRLEKLMEEIKGLKNTDFEDRGTAVQCPRCVFGCNCPKIFVQRAKTDDNLKHYYFCEECNFITLTQQALELHLRVAHLNTHQPQQGKMTRTNDAEEAGHVHFQCKMGFFTRSDKLVLERRSELENQRSHCTFFADQPKIAGCKPSLYKSAFGEKARFTHHPFGKEVIQKSIDKTLNPPQFKRHIGHTKNTLSPSLWRISKRGKLLLQPGGRLDVATDLTCVEEDAEKHDHKAFGSSKQANCPATADFLLSARNLKLDQMFCEGSENDPESRIRELERGCEGGHNFSDDSRKATGSFLESSENERNPYARKYFKKRQRFSAKDQSPHIPKDEASPCVVKSDSFDVFPSQVVEHKPCPYCPAVFESGVAVKAETQGEHKCPLCCSWFDSKTGLSNHVRGHLKRIGRSISSTSKSPLGVLNELLRDTKQHENILRVVNKGQVPQRPSVSPKFIDSGGLVLMHPAVPVKIQYEVKSPHAIGDRFVPKEEAQAFSERIRPHAEAQRGMKASSTLVELLKKRQESMELTERNHDVCTARTKDYKEETEMTGLEPSWNHGKCDSNKIRIQCNSNFPTSVSLSDHLQAYACRKRIAVFEEPGCDYKQKKPRPRPGLKKKILPSLNAQIYTLTCRYIEWSFTCKHGSLTKE
ncbi:hypothetical protein F2P81_006075 [Scophthalmus maximus]|uniref:C2H2-type domain-containing protein n=1 Tax=Scophthalmus maximus TaxID=52904 RepID=A0A6A4T8Z3_SCOMX|nr:hypothetical protein F2P81_006075 [Scophthalmus maximus]